MKSPDTPSRSLFDIALGHLRSGMLADAERFAREALVQQRERPAGVLQLLGVISVEQEQYEQAVSWFRQAIDCDPSVPEAYSNLGNALKENRQLEDAITAFQQALTLKPIFPEAYNNLANALKANNQFDEAIAAYRKAIEQSPSAAKFHHNLGNALHANGQPIEAIAAYQRAIELAPTLVASHGRLRAVLAENGLLDEALAAGRKAMSVFPELADFHSDVVFSLLLYPDWTAKAVAKELGQWNRQHAEPLRPTAPVYPNAKQPDRRLRIGYVSADFRDHVLGRNLIPLLAHHDKSAFELFAYASVHKPDFRTEQIRSHFDHWRAVWGVADAELAEQIRQDQIDVLVDLALHTSDNRLLTFARKPVPVQITFGGYPGTTGLSTIDYRLSDPYLDPPDADTSVYSEKTIRLPNSFWCYDPLENRDLLAGPLPSLSCGVITFGCLNQLNKINGVVLSLWARVLERVKESRLLLIDRTGKPSAFACDRLRRNGIDPERVKYVPRQTVPEYMRLYQQIDLGLDTFPYNGHTTSLDSVWMGVPVVTLVGSTVASRAGWCHLSNLGLTELAAHTPDQFVQIAVDLAHDRPRLQHLRSTLRERMEASPLMDGKGFARGIEDAFRYAWKTHCSSVATAQK